MLANVPRRATKAEEAKVLETEAKAKVVVLASSAVKRATSREIVLRVETRAREKAKAVVVSATTSVTRAAADSVMSVVSSTLLLERYDQILYPVICIFFFEIVSLHTCRASLT